MIPPFAGAFENLLTSPMPGPQFPGNHVAVGKSAKYNQPGRCYTALKALSQIRVVMFFS